MADKTVSNLTSIGTLADGDTGDSIYVVAGGNSRRAQLGGLATILPSGATTDNAIARFNGVSGALQGSDTLLDDDENVTGIGNVTGKAGGITVTGGTGSGDDIRITSTSNATKGTINLGNASTGLFFDETDERISLGDAANSFTFAGVALGSDVTVHNSDNSEVCLAVARYSAAATAPACFFGLRARGTGPGAEAIVQSGDRLLLLQGHGFDGVDYEIAGRIELYSAGTPGSNDMPGEWRFSTTPDGSATPVEAMRINSDQSVQISSVLRADANDGAALGVSGTAWSDLFLASGAVVNFNAGNYTITHSAGDLAFSGIVTLVNTGLHLLDTNASHDLIITPGSDLTADRTLAITTGDTNITLNLTDPGADRLMFWDESASTWRDLTLGTNLSITDTTLNATGGSGGITAGTVQATTSGSAIDFTSLPAGINRITVILDQVSLSGTDDLLIQLGDSGGIETTGYTCQSVVVSGAGTSISADTTGFNISSGSATRAISGIMVLCRITSNTWVASFTGSTSAGTAMGVYSAGSKSLSAELDRLRIDTDGTDTFDAGQINIFYE
jgi:hypothetical protein